MSGPRSAEIRFKKVEPSYDPDRDTFIAFEAVTDGSLLQVSLGEFPDQPRYALLVDGEIAESFDDWPAGWVV